MHEAACACTCTCKTPCLPYPQLSNPILRFHLFSLLLPLADKDEDAPLEAAAPCYMCGAEAVLPHLNCANIDVSGVNAVCLWQHEYLRSGLLRLC